MAGKTAHDDAGRALHARLLAGDVTASSDLAAAYLEPLVTWLLRHNPTLDPHLCETAADDAILALIANPSGYTPQKMGLQAYLRMSASGDLKNALRREARHGRGRARLDAVELSPELGKYVQDAGADPARIVEGREAVIELIDRRRRVPRAVRALLTDAERRALALLLEGERRTAMYAAALDIADLTPAEQRREVKRVKDRLKKRLTRSGDADG